MSTVRVPVSRLAERTDDPAFVIEAEAVRIGDDVLVYVWGGEIPHIGAVAAAQPRPSLADAADTSATASVLTYLGHKEDEVVKSMSEALSSALNRKVVVTAGIHWDGLEPADIKVIRGRVEEITGKLVRRLREKEIRS